MVDPKLQEKLTLFAPDAPIGLFDSGLGGLTVFRSIHKRLPSELLLYLGDTARTPYGPKGRETIVRYARECSRFLIEREIKLLVVACNTVSSFALHVLESECECPVLGTIDSASQAAVSTTRNGKIGIIGTEATIGSRVYEEAIQNLSDSPELFSIACPLFVPLVEQGMFEGPIVAQLIDLYLAPLKRSRIDTLVLGCTHYPLLVDALNKYFEGTVSLVTCSDALATEVSTLLSSENKHASKRRGPDEFYVTDDRDRFNRFGGLILSDRTVTAEQVSL